jgi:hypothetical protein
VPPPRRAHRNPGGRDFDLELRGGRAEVELARRCRATRRTCRVRGGGGPRRLLQRLDQQRLRAPHDVRRTPLVGRRAPQVHRVAIESDAGRRIRGEVIDRPRSGDVHDVTAVSNLLHTRAPGGAGGAGGGQTGERRDDRRVPDQGSSPALGCARCHAWQIPCSRQYRDLPGALGPWSEGQPAAIPAVVSHTPDRTVASLAERKPRMERSRPTRLSPVPA